MGKEKLLCRLQHLPQRQLQNERRPQHDRIPKDFLPFCKPTVTLLHRTAPSSITHLLVPAYRESRRRWPPPPAASQAPQPPALLRPASLLSLPLPAAPPVRIASRPYRSRPHLSSASASLIRATSRSLSRLRLLHMPPLCRPPIHSDVDF
jgi:hypothetical protein